MCTQGLKSIFLQSYDPANLERQDVVTHQLNEATQISDMNINDTIAVASESVLMQPEILEVAMEILSS